jgi:hypothetical protein
MQPPNIRASDPHWFNADQDAAFFLLRIRIQGFVDQKFKQILHLKKNVYFWINNGNYLSIGQKKPSAPKRTLPALQNTKILTFFYFSGSFLPSWIRIQQLKLMQIRIRNLAKYIQLSASLSTHDPFDNKADDNMYFSCAFLSWPPLFFTYLQPLTFHKPVVMLRAANHSLLLGSSLLLATTRRRSIGALPLSILYLPSRRHLNFF